MILKIEKINSLFNNLISLLSTNMDILPFIQKHQSQNYKWLKNNLSQLNNLDLLDIITLLTNYSNDNDKLRSLLLIIRSDQYKTYMLKFNTTHHIYFFYKMLPKIINLFSSNISKILAFENIIKGLEIDHICISNININKITKIFSDDKFKYEIIIRWLHRIPQDKNKKNLYNLLTIIKQDFLYLIKLLQKFEPDAKLLKQIICYVHDDYYKIKIIKLTLCAFDYYDIYDIIHTTHNENKIHIFDYLRYLYDFEINHIDNIASLLMLFNSDNDKLYVVQKIHRKCRFNIDTHNIDLLLLPVFNDKNIYSACYNIFIKIKSCVSESDGSDETESDESDETESDGSDETESDEPITSTINGIENNDLIPVPIESTYKKFIDLSLIPDADGIVDFLANKDKGNYINLKGSNTKDTIDCVHSFLCKYGVWNKDDRVIHTRKPINFQPLRPMFYDISFIMTFYKMACNV